MRPNCTNCLRMLQAAGLACLSFSTSSSLAQDQVTYEFEWVAEWSAQTHPIGFPQGSSHFSGVTGMNHTSDVQLWGPGAIATNGIEDMAESGSTSILRNEIQALIDNGTAQNIYRLGSLPRSPGSLVREFDISRQFPLLSLVTMIAPSPDWFVGIHDIDMRPDGQWVQELIIDVFPYDSGTDSGSTYTSSNADVTPHAPIANISGSFPFTNTPRIGTFRLTLLSAISCGPADFAEPFGNMDFFDVSAFLDAFVDGDETADVNRDGDIDFFDVSDFLESYNTGCP